MLVIWQIEEEGKEEGIWCPVWEQTRAVKDLDHCI
jgi:hypothetical protein